MKAPAPPPVRLAEVLGALAMAADSSAGLPAGTSLGAAVVAARVGAALGLPEAQRAAHFHATVLRFSGCTVGAHESTHVFRSGDDRAMNRLYAETDLGDPPAFYQATQDRLAAHLDPAARAEAIGAVLGDLPAFIEMGVAHCELARQIAERLGLGPEVMASLAQVYERPDGMGFPRGLSGEDVDLGARVMRLASTTELFRRVGGLPLALEVAAQRRGGELDPALADLYRTEARALTAGLSAPVTWDLYLDAEPGCGAVVPREALPDMARALAWMVDHKSVWTLSHSTGVARLAGQAARLAGLPDPDQVEIAACLHDLGRAAVANQIWDKPSALSPAERRAVTAHSAATEAALECSAGLAPYRAIAGHAHERADGSGYPRRAQAVATGAEAAVLAAADMYHALTEARPWRTAFSPSVAADMLREEARSGRLAAPAVGAVLDAAGLPRARSEPWPGGLTDREIEVLRLIARGRSNRQAATRLGVSPKTIDNHVQHIYEKIGVSTRAGAALYAVKRGLMS